ncbi:MAG: lamin tail domain-containing protein, partial [Reichenbachiella sp.]
MKNASQLTLFFDEALTQSNANQESNYFINSGIGHPQHATIGEENPTSVTLRFNSDLTEELNYTLSLSNLSDLSGNIMTEKLESSLLFHNSIDTVHVQGANQLQILFKDEVTRTSVTNPNNYHISDEIGYPVSAILHEENDQLIELLFKNEFDNNKQLTLAISNITDVNSQLLTTPDTYFEFDASSPRLDTIIAVDDHSIKIIFLERVDKTSAQKLHHYQLNDNEYPIHAALNISESNVLLEFNEAFIPEEEYEIRVAEVEDLFGNAISTRLKGSFVYDPIAPQLDSLIVRSEHDITLLFHERLFINTATNPQNYLVDNQFAPNSIWHDSELGQKVILSFEKPLLASNDHMLEISNIADIRGNTIQTTIEKPFDNTSFSISEIIVHSSRQIELLFNKKPHPTSGSNIANYVIQEEQINSLSINEHAVILDLTDDLVNQSNYILTVQNVSDKNNQALSIINYSFLFDSKFNSANWLNRKTIELTFDTPIDQDFLVPGLFQINGQVPSYAIVSTENNHIIRLFFNQDFATDETHTLEWQSLTNIYGNKVPGYRIKLIIDTQAPIATSLQVINNHEVQIQFNESLDPTTATFLPYYEVLQFGNPISIHGQEEDTSVLLSFDKNFIDNQPYQLQITDLLDLAGNVLDTTTLAFTYQSPYLPQYGELIVSEIMAEPNEGEPEFIELYNASNQTLELKGLIWKDGTGESYFSTGSIAPKSYLVISQKPLTGNINSGALNSWLTLNNGGETLSIYAGESLVFSTSYTSDWYQQDDTKGHSLEMVDLSNFCGEETNWSASLSENGTPGSVNSNTAQNPDHFGPSIQSIFATSPNTIELLMSEKLIPKPSMVDEITITPELIINSAELVSPQNNKIEITLGQALVSSQAYELSLDILTDCAANMLTSDGRQATFWLPQLGDSLDLLLNEILFNPKTGGVDFVEVYNNSDKYIDLLGWELQSEKGDGSIDSKVIADDHLIIAPQSYLVFTSDIDMLSANYPISKPENFIPMPSFPSYNDDAGIVTLRNNHSNVIDRLSYSEDYHFELLDDVEGVSLERIAFDVPTDDHNSWQSAASTSYYATPGFVNSQFIGASNLIGLLVIEPKTFFPNGNGQDDFTTIRYQLKHPGNMGNILIYDTQGRMVKSLVENQLLAASGSFKWDGAQNSGAMSKLGYYIVYFEIFDS